MSDVISFVKWNSTPDGLESNQSFFTTKYYDLGTSSNKVKVLKFIANLIIDANTTAALKVEYRTDTVSSFSQYGFRNVNPSTTSGSEVILVNHINDVKGIQFKITLVSSGSTALNDFHFKYRQKRNFNVEQE